MSTQHPHKPPGVRRRALLKTGLVAGVTLEARWKIIFDIQRYAAEQQYYVYLFSQMITGSWQPYVKNYAPNQSFDYGSPAAALWLER